MEPGPGAGDGKTFDKSFQLNDSYAIPLLVPRGGAWSDLIERQGRNGSCRSSHASNCGFALFVFNLKSLSNRAFIHQSDHVRHCWRCRKLLFAHTYNHRFTPEDETPYISEIAAMMGLRHAYLRLERRPPDKNEHTHTHTHPTATLSRAARQIMSPE